MDLRRDTTMADVNITITIPDARKTRVFDAFTSLGDKTIELEGVGVIKTFIIPGKSGSETNREFAKRFIRRAMWQFVRLWEQSEKDGAYVSNIESVTREIEDVPEDVFT
jgi:hypothetical protein